MAKEQFQVELISNTDIANSVKQLRFVRKDGQKLDYIPGQFINLHFTIENQTYQRSYSIASPPNDEGLIDIAISFVKDGRASNLLFNLKPSDEISMSGPFGRLVLKEEQPKRYIFVATGTGVAPYKSMFDELEQRMTADPNLSIIILLGVRSKAELLYEQDLAEFAKKNPRCTFIACCSRETSEDLASYIHKCRVTNILPKLDLNPEEDIVFLCGNPDMIDEAFKFCTDQGFNFKNVKREKYIFSK